MPGFTTLTGFIVSGIIASVAAIMYREYQHSQQVKALRDVIRKKETENQALLERLKKYGEIIADIPAHDPSNIQL